MWGVNPKLLCRKHLLGEHVEMHMFVGSINKGFSIDGFINTGLVETDKIRKRHGELANEMLHRGYNHNSLLPEFKIRKGCNISLNKNLKDLYNRCIICKERGLK